MSPPVRFAVTWLIVAPVLLCFAVALGMLLGIAVGVVLGVLIFIACVDAAWRALLKIDAPKSGAAG